MEEGEAADRNEQKAKGESCYADLLTYLDRARGSYSFVRMLNSKPRLPSPPPPPLVMFLYVSMSLK